MCKKVTTEDFIKKAKKVHGDKYDYSKTEYVATRESVTITCFIHGDFSQRANCHTNGKGCKKCGLVDRAKKRTMNNQLFIEKANLIFNSNYDYSLIEYKNNNSLLEIVCPQHGIFIKKANKHLQGQGCQLCSSVNHSGKFKNLTNELFISKAKKVHGELYDYSKTTYKNAIETVEIICKKHGVFNQTPHTHLCGSGCNKCGIDRTADKKRTVIEIFIQQANNRHGEKYSYENVIYKNSGVKVIITCKLHGDFKQTPSSHLSGNGCSTCARILTTQHNKNEPSGWSYTNWIRAGEKSKHFDSFKVYIIRCWNDKEEFYKVGRTFKKVKDRFDDKNTMPYNYEITLEIISNAKIILELEKSLQSRYKELRYLPNNVFCGMHECFNLSLPTQEIIDYLQTLTL